MSIKEQLLLFINDNVDDTNYTLKINTIIQNTGQNCFMTIGAPKTRITQIITENFNEELQGSMPNDSFTHQILSWEVVQR